MLNFFKKTQFSLGFTERYFYLNEKKNCVNEVQEPAPDRGRVRKEEKTFSTRLLWTPSFFMSCSGLKFSHPCQLTIVAMWQRSWKRMIFFISIVNNKLERVPQFHAMSTHTDGSLCETNLNFEFQHDSRLYEGICVHVCIYLFMCNLTGTVNMVHLLRLLFFIYLVPPVLVGLNIRLVLYVVLRFLGNRRVF